MNVEQPFFNYDKARKYVYKSRVLVFLLRVARKFGLFNKAGNRQEIYIRKLDKLERQVRFVVQSRQIDKKLRILFGPNFTIYPPSFIHDRILSYALRLRGAEIVPFYCDGVQSVECDVHAGVWMSKSFNEHCLDCVQQSKMLWAVNPTKAKLLSRYLNESDIEEATATVNSLGNEEWISYSQEGFPYGYWAKDILTNHHVVADYQLVKNYPALGRAHLKNLLLLKKAYARLLDEIKPDRVVANDSYYGMYAIMQKLCEKENIPFYSNWSGARQGGWCYAKDDAAMNLDFSKPWRKFSQNNLNDQQKAKISKWMDERTHGADMVFNTASVAKHQKIRFDFNKLDKKKPTALLAANVIWDLAAIDKQIIFEDMISWIKSTIEWFSNNPEFQLIIKPHPAENNPSLPVTKESVEFALKANGVVLPSNVFMLSPKSRVTVYELFPIVKVGIMHTSTVGIEMAARDIPVITTAKSPYRGFGFTIDPKSEVEYFTSLNKILIGDNAPIPSKQIDLAWKFIMFYNFHYYAKIDIMEYSWGEVPVLKVNDIKQIMPGANKYLDYVVDSIINGLPILSEDRWPPES